MTEEFIQQQALQDLARERRRVSIDFDGACLFCIIAAVQLALRHPYAPASTRAILLEFIEHAKQKLAPNGGPIADAIDRGNDTEQDETPDQQEELSAIALAVLKEMSEAYKGRGEILNEDMICARLGLSMPSVVAALEELQARGFIRRQETKN